MSTVFATAVCAARGLRHQPSYDAPTGASREPARAERGRGELFGRRVDEPAAMTLMHAKRDPGSRVCSEAHGGPWETRASDLDGLRMCPLLCPPAPTSIAAEPKRRGIIIRMSGVRVRPPALLLLAGRVSKNGSKTTKAQQTGLPTGQVTPSDGDARKASHTPAASACDQTFSARARCMPS